jgi:putative ABC transport system ATP-binding protein
MVANGIAVFSRDVTKVFGRGDTQVHALRGIDLEIRLGELTMLVGPSGSGKTTLLSVITGLLDATSGELVVLGERPTALAPEELILFRRENLGFVFQQYNLIPALTAAENVAVPLLAGGIKRQQAVARGKELLATLGMAHRAPRVAFRALRWGAAAGGLGPGTGSRAEVDRLRRTDVSP